MNILFGPACKTEFLEENETEGMRVRAKHFNTLREVVVEWDDRLDLLENHARAASQLLEGDDFICCGVNNGGYVFVLR